MHHNHIGASRYTALFRIKRTFTARCFRSSLFGRSCRIARRTAKIDKPPPPPPPTSGACDTIITQNRFACFRPITAADKSSSRSRPQSITAPRKRAPSHLTGLETRLPRRPPSATDNVSNQCSGRIFFFFCFPLEFGHESLREWNSAKKRRVYYIKVIV